MALFAFPNIAKLDYGEEFAKLALEKGVALVPAQVADKDK